MIDRAMMESSTACGSMSHRIVIIVFVGGIFGWILREDCDAL